MQSNPSLCSDNLYDDNCVYGRPNNFKEIQRSSTPWRKKLNSVWVRWMQEQDAGARQIRRQSLQFNKLNTITTHHKFKWMGVRDLWITRIIIITMIRMIHEIVELLERLNKFIVLINSKVQTNNNNNNNRTRTVMENYTNWNVFKELPNSMYAFLAVTMATLAVALASSLVNHCCVIMKIKCMCYPFPDYTEHLTQVHLAQADYSRDCAKSKCALKETSFIRFDAKRLARYTHHFFGIGCRKLCSLLQPIQRCRLIRYIQFIHGVRTSSPPSSLSSTQYRKAALHIMLLSGVSTPSM